MEEKVNAAVDRLTEESKEKTTGSDTEIKSDLQSVSSNS